MRVIFAEIRILRLHLSDFDDIFTIGSEFAFRARFRTPFRADFVKNAVSENFCFRILRKISENFLKKKLFSKLLEFTIIKPLGLGALLGGLLTPLVVFSSSELFLEIIFSISIPKSVFFFVKTYGRLQKKNH